MRIGGIGYEVAVKEQLDGQWYWKVTRFGRLLGEGTCQKKAVAEKQADEALLRVMKSSATIGAERQKYRLKLKYLTERRPYLVAAVTELCLMGGMEIKRVYREIEGAEKAWWKQDDPKVRVALPTHHRALKPPEAGKAVLECLAGMGFVEINEDKTISLNGRKLRKWAGTTFGERYFTAGNDMINEDEVEPNDY